MTLIEYNQKVLSGRRVYVLNPDGAKVYGTACNLISAGKVEPGISFDSGQLVRVTERTAELVHLEEAN